MLEKLSEVELGDLRRFIRKSQNIALLEKQSLETPAFAEALGASQKRIREFEKGILIDPLKSAIRKKYEAELLKTVMKISSDLKKSRKYKKLFAAPKPAPTMAVQPLLAIGHPETSEKENAKPRHPASESGFDIQIEKTVITVRTGDTFTIKVLPGKVLKISWK